VRVTAVVVTFNRKDLLLECLDALARQTCPLARVLLVDNASTDGTREAVERAGLPDRLPLEYLRLTRNGGGAEGFHFGVHEAMRGESDWIWLMDDDCEPADDALELLLAAPRASDPETVGLAGAVRLPTGELLPMHRGWITRRPFRAPMSALAPRAYAEPQSAFDFASFVGPLYRSAAVRAVGAPLREAFIRFEDLEYAARMRSQGSMCLVPASVIHHKEGVPVTSTDLRTLWRDFSISARFSDQWKNVYGLRNVIYAGRRHEFVSAGAALSYAAVQVGRALAFDESKLRTARLVATYAYDGWRGLFRNVPPAHWSPLADTDDPIGYLNAKALPYDCDVVDQVTRLPSAGAAPIPAA